MPSLPPFVRNLFRPPAPHGEEKAPAAPAVAEREPPVPPAAAPKLNSSLLIQALARVASLPTYPQLPGSDPAVLAEFGRRVRERLDADPKVEKLPAFKVEMYCVRGFLSGQECGALLDMIDEDVRPSTVLVDGANEGIRTSETCRLSSSVPLVEEVERRICNLLGLPQSHSETVQGQRYRKGQRFKVHNDYFDGDQPFSEAVAREGGQRTWTAMVFLNRPAAGGCTHFPEARMKVEPELGMLLAWNNVDPDGITNPYSDHEGMAVEAGVKYILTKWFREREWQTNAASDTFRA